MIVYVYICVYLEATPSIVFSSPLKVTSLEVCCAVGDVLFDLLSERRGKAASMSSKSTMLCAKT